MNLKNVSYIDQLRRLHLPVNKFLIFGSATMALLGIKNNDDLDLWVTEDLFKTMAKDRNLNPIMKHGRLFYTTPDGNIDITNTIPCTKGKVEDYLKRSIIIYGFHFVSVDDLIAWKKCMGRPKDLEHIRMLEKFKKDKVVENYLKLLQVL